MTESACPPWIKAISFVYSLAAFDSSISGDRPVILRLQKELCFACVSHSRGSPLNWDSCEMSALLYVGSCHSHALCVNVYLIAGWIFLDVLWMRPRPRHVCLAGSRHCPSPQICIVLGRWGVIIFLRWWSRVCLKGTLPSAHKEDQRAGDPQERNISLGEVASCRQACWCDGLKISTWKPFSGCQYKTRYQRLCVCV